MTEAELEAEILKAHAEEDEESLAELYGQAGDMKLAAGETDAACFFHTQAYVFALSAGHAGQVAKSHALLCRFGREE